MANPLNSLSSEIGFRNLLLRIPQERSVEGILSLVVAGFAERPDTALARIWLIGEGDRCQTCSQAADCTRRKTCLHLVASAGASRRRPGVKWTSLDGDFSRFPIGVRKVGRIAQSGEPLEITDMGSGKEWMARPGWIAEEGIKGFIGQPLSYRGETLGVLAVFLRAAPGPAELTWLRMIADHVAISIVNARAFEEIETLRHRLELENECLREELAGEQGQDSMVGRSAALQNIRMQIDLVAPTDATVLILGETGTGKELVAREIHRKSSRRDRPMIRVNCASIPRDLFESEFFGHVKGAFTGALRDRAGRLEAANGGTIFLDEVGEIPMELQGKLLRVIQDGEYERVGDDRTQKVDVRIMAATNRDLKRDIQLKTFRSDLYYRLNVFPVQLPPLRERKEDIPLLVSHLLGQSGKRLGKSGLIVPEGEMLSLLDYDWPGNIRELQNAVERASITCRDSGLRFNLVARQELSREPKPAGGSAVEIVTEEARRARDKKNIEAALEMSGGRIYGKGGAAEILGIPPTTLNARLRRFGLKRRYIA